MTDNLIEYGWMPGEDTPPPMGKFRPMWEGHIENVLAHKHVFLNVDGLGGAFKYVFYKEDTMYGRRVVIYFHIHNRFRMVACMIHDGTPTVVVKRHLLQNDEKTVWAVMWEYSATDRSIASKFYWADEPCFD